LNGFPAVTKFMESLYLSGNEEQLKKYQIYIEEIYNSVRKNLYDDLDYSLFREDIDPKNTVRYIKWLMDTYEADLMARLKDGKLGAMDKNFLAGEWRRYYVFVEDLRKIFYKKR